MCPHGGAASPGGSWNVALRCCDELAPVYWHMCPCVADIYVTHTHPHTHTHTPRIQSDSNDFFPCRFPNFHQFLWQKMSTSCRVQGNVLHASARMRCSSLHATSKVWCIANVSQPNTPIGGHTGVQHLFCQFIRYSNVAVQRFYLRKVYFIREVVETT